MLRIANRDVMWADHPSAASLSIVLPASSLCKCGWNL